MGLVLLQINTVEGMAMIMSVTGMIVIVLAFCLHWKPCVFMLATPGIFHMKNTLMVMVRDHVVSQECCEYDQQHSRYDSLHVHARAQK